MKAALAVSKSKVGECELVSRTCMCVFSVYSILHYMRVYRNIGYGRNNTCVKTTYKIINDNAVMMTITKYIWYISIHMYTHI